MLKKLTSLLIVFCVLFTGFTALAAQEVKVYVEGIEVVSDVPAVITNDTTMLPFRAIFNALGIDDDKITWHASSRSIEVKTADTYIFLVIGSAGAVVNDALYTLNTVPYIENGRTMVPVRFISEALGANVEWDGSVNTVWITKP